MKYTTSIISRLFRVGKCQESGSVINKKGSQPKIDDDAAQIEVRCEFAIIPNLSVRQATSPTGISLESVRKVLKCHKFHLYEI